MKKSVGLVLVLLLFFVLLSVVGFAPTEDMLFCGTTFSEDYTMTVGTTCSEGITIDTQGIVFDCAGYVIGGEGDGTGITVTADNVEIKNCEISDFKYGIYFNEVESGVVHDNTFMNNGGSLENGNGVRIRYGSGHVIYDNSFDGNWYGVSIGNTEDIEVYQNTITDSGKIGVYSSTNTNVQIYDNSISGVAGEEDIGVNFYSCSGCSVTLNEIQSSSYGIKIMLSDDISMSENTISSTTEYSISVEDSDVVALEKNNISDTTTGMNIDTCTDVSVSENIISEEITSKGIDFQSSEVTLFDLNKINSVGWGVDSSLTKYDSFVSNVIYGDSLGIKWYYSSAEDLSSNYICGSEDYDFYCSAASSDESKGSGNFMDTMFSCDVSENTCYDDICNGDYQVANCFEDTDGGIVFDEVGRIKDEEGNTIGSDECLDGSFLLETYCEENIPMAAVYECADYCGGEMGEAHCMNSDDEPSNEATLAGDVGGDTDGDDPLVDGYCGSHEVTLEDVCIDDKYLLEADCYSDGIYATYYQCSEDSSLFPDDFLSDTYTCVESDACGDGLDNDADGLVDCADDECNLLSCDSERNDYSCIEGNCTQTVLPDAEEATVQVQEIISGMLFSYDDFFTWLNSATVYHEEGVCDDICSSYSQKCLFADAGRSLCSDEASEKCTCV